MSHPPSDQPVGAGTPDPSTADATAFGGGAPDASGTRRTDGPGSSAARPPGPTGPSHPEAAVGDAGWDDEKRPTGPVPVVPRPAGPPRPDQRPGHVPTPFGGPQPPAGGPSFGPVPPGAGRRAVAFGVSSYGPGADSAARRPGIGAPRALSAVVALLGLVNLMAGFLPEVTLPEATRNAAASVSVYAVGPGWVPLLLLVGGLLAAASLLPDGRDQRFAAAAVSVAGAVGAVIGLGIPNGFEQLLGNGRGNGAGALLLFIVGTIQAVVAIAAHVVGGGEPRTPPGRTASVQWTSAAGRPADADPHPFPAGPVPSGPSPWAPGRPAPTAPPGGRPGPAAPGGGTAH